MSLRASTSSSRPAACSGAMKAGVPSTLPTSVNGEESWSDAEGAGLPVATSAGAPPNFASPQSTTSVSPNSPIMTLAGFRSRWTTPRECAYATPRQTSWKIPSRRARENVLLASASPERRRSVSSLSVRPRMRFMQRKSFRPPPCVDKRPKSCTGTTFG